MKKLALILGVASITMAATASYAQGPFADVPTDHWAYAAVNQLQQQGIFTGYPDGTFGGKRAMTRYEFAVALQRAINFLMTNAGGKVDLGPLTSRVDALEGRVNNLQGAVDNLNRLVNEFRDTLAQLGTNVDQLRRDLNALTDRVTAIEQQLDRMPKFTGVGNIGFRASNGRTSPGLGGSFIDTDRDIRPMGFAGQDESFLQGVVAVYDLDLGLTARLGDVATLKALLNVGNYVDGYLTGNLSTLSPGAPFFPATTESASAFMIPYYLYIEAPVNFGFGGAALTVGKFGQQFTPYTLKMVDVDSYFNNDKTDSGDYPMVGGKVATRIGAVQVLAYAATHTSNTRTPINSTAVPGFPFSNGSAVFTTEGPFGPSASDPNNLASPSPGSMPGFGVIGWDQSAGVHLSAGTPWGGTAGLTYIGAGTTDPADVLGRKARRREVFGGNLNITPFRGIGVDAEYVTTTGYGPGNGSHGIGGKNRNAIDVGVTTALGNLGISARYQQVGSAFDAPGYWNNIGRFRNVRNIEGFKGDLNYALGGRTKLYITGGRWRQPQRGPGQDNFVEHLLAGVSYGLSSSNNVDLGVELASFYQSGAGAAFTGAYRERFYNIGYGHSFNPNMSVKVLYQIMETSLGFTPAGGATVNGSSRGNLAVTQFTLRF